MNPLPLAIFDVGGQELIVIFLVILIFFGPKKLPELARGLARVKNEFNKASRDFNDEIERAASLPDEPSTPKPLENQHAKSHSETSSNPDKDSKKSASSSHE